MPGRFTGARHVPWVKSNWAPSLRLRVALAAHILHMLEKAGRVAGCFQWEVQCRQTPSPGIMKTFFKFLVIPVVFQALVCSEVMAAKKDDPDDAKNKKGERQEQAAKEKGKNSQQARKPDSGQKAQKQVPRQNVKPDQPKKKKQAPQQAKKPDSQPSKKAVQPSKKDSGPRSADKQKDGASPGKRSGAGDADKTGKAGKADKAGKTEKSDKALPLPGKRPNVPGAARKDTPDKPEQAKRAKKSDGPARADMKTAESRKERVVRPGQNTRQVRRPDMDRDRSNTWWDSGRRSAAGRRDDRATNVTVNNNFRRNVNWSTRRHDWGYNPWWNRHAVRPWYGSSWNYGWSPNYYRHHYHYYGYRGYRPPGYYVDPLPAIGWGLIGWSLGAMIYDTGYRTYYNPYPVRPVYQVTYTEPITRVAVNSAPADDAAVAEITSKSESLIAESQTEFKQRNYLVALELADKAIAESPGDGALHEYRALILFALGKYGEAAGVLNPVLVSGPGWEWSTMIALYDAQETYTDQLQRLEAYTEEKPDAADTHFLLGYHYMVCGHLDLATPQFELAAKLMPSDSVSKELAELTRNSAKSSGEAKPAEAEEEAEDSPAPEPVPLEKLTGVWISSRDAGSSITLTFKDDGKFTWSFVKDGKTTEFSGEFSINDEGLLVLDSEESQMVARVALPQESEMKFVLAGGPPADPGLAFKKN